MLDLCYVLTIFTLNSLVNCNHIEATASIVYPNSYDFKTKPERLKALQTLDECQQCFSLDNGKLYLVQILYASCVCNLCPLPLGKVFNVLCDCRGSSSPWRSRFHEHEPCYTDILRHTFAPSPIQSGQKHPLKRTNLYKRKTWRVCCRPVAGLCVTMFAVDCCALQASFCLTRPPPLHCPAPSTAMETGTAEDPCPPLTEDCR